jgi:hypothetical protein
VTEEINVKKMKPIDFCIIVYWMHGMTIGQIYKSFGHRVGKSEAAIRGITNRLPRRRSEMTKQDRQKFLDHMKAGRLDDRMLPDTFYIAAPTTTDKKMKVDPRPKKQKEVQEDIDSDLDLSTKEGKKELKRRRMERAKKAAKEAADEQERLRNGGAKRGQESAAFEILCSRDMLADPGEKKGNLRHKGSPSLMRQSAGHRLRPMLESVYGSGLKTQSFDSSFGGSGAGVVIHARVAENIAEINNIKAMLGTDNFRQLDAVLREDRFIWDVPSKEAKNLVLDDIRRSLDLIDVYYGNIKAESFYERWGYMPVAPSRPRRSDIRRATLDAQDAILKAQRQAR